MLSRPVPPSRQALIASLRNAEAALRVIGSDWHSGVSGEVRARVLAVANPLLQMLMRIDGTALGPQRGGLAERGEGPSPVKPPEFLTLTGQFAPNHKPKG